MKALYRMDKIGGGYVYTISTGMEAALKGYIAAYCEEPSGIEDIASEVDIEGYFE